MRWFNYRAGDPAEQHFIVTPDGKDKEPVSRTQPNSKGRWREQFDVSGDDMLLAVFRTKAGKQKADYSLPKHPTEAQMIRLREFLAIYQYEYRADAAKEGVA